jgi:hypothetical protein
MRDLRSTFTRFSAPWDRQNAQRVGFDAFISYRRAPDSITASALRDGLHAFARPWYRLRSSRVYLDDSSQSATSALWPSIERALLASGYFILLASTEAATSRWITREVETWLEFDPRGRKLLLVLTDGELEWADDFHDFDSARSSALPPALYGGTRRELG